MLSIASLILVVLAALSASLVGLYHIGVMSIPEPIEKLLGLDDDDTGSISASPDESPLLSLLNGKEDITASGLKITDGEYLALIEDTEPLQEYSAVLNVTLTGDGVQSNKRHHIWCMGDKYRAETYDSATSELESIIICDGRRISVTDAAGYEEPITRTFDTGDKFTLSNQIGIPSITDFLGRDDIENLVIRMVRSSTDNLYYVTYNYIGHSQVEEMYISLEHRMILKAESHAIGASGTAEKVYSLETLSLVDGDISAYGNPDLLFSVD